jgi:hypothetical protein
VELLDAAAASALQLAGPSYSFADHSGLLSFSVNAENMMLKLMLILSSWLAFAVTECRK